MNDEPVTLVRYGLMGYVDWFAGTLPDGSTTALERSQLVVIRTDRGEELGEVLLHLPSSSRESKPHRRSRRANATAPPNSMADNRAGRPRLLRAASSADLEHFRQAERLRDERFELCRQILAETCWPVELLDAEPLLDLDTTVLHILGPWDLDLALLRAEFRGRCAFHVVFESLASRPGSCLDGATEPLSVPAGRCCGDCNCALGSCPTRHECASEGEQEISERSSFAVLASCGDRVHASCARCELSKWLAAKR